MRKENFFGNELFMVNLDVTGFLNHTCMQLIKTISPIKRKK